MNKEVGYKMHMEIPQLRDLGFNKSQIARKSRNIPPVIFEKIFDQIKLEALAKRGSNFYKNNLGQLNIIDTSTISMALSNYLWADFRSTKA